jgi:hypothetical protein
MFPSGEPMEVFVRFGKAGGCGSAMADGIAKLMSYGLRSGLDPHDAVKALSGIGCHLGSNTCLNVIAESVGFVMQHLETGCDINELMEAFDFRADNITNDYLCDISLPKFVRSA